MPVYGMSSLDCTEGAQDKKKAMLTKCLRRTSVWDSLCRLARSAPMVLVEQTSFSANSEAWYSTGLLRGCALYLFINRSLNDRPHVPVALASCVKYQAIKTNVSGSCQEHAVARSKVRKDGAFAPRHIYFFLRTATRQ